MTREGNLSQDRDVSVQSCAIHHQLQPTEHKSVLVPSYIPLWLLQLCHLLAGSLASQLYASSSPNHQSMLRLAGHELGRAQSAHRAAQSTYGYEADAVDVTLFMQVRGLGWQASDQGGKYQDATECRIPVATAATPVWTSQVQFAALLK